MKLWYSIKISNQWHKIHVLTSRRCGKKSNYNINIEGVVCAIEEDLNQ